MARSCLAVLLAAVSLCAQTARWKVRFFHDEQKSAFSILDLQFGSALNGIAIGMLSEDGGGRSMAAITGDGGKTWSLSKLPDGARSAFYLEPGALWVAADDDIHKSADGGRTWTRVSKLKGAVRVAFFDRNRGLAAGFPKKAWETSDGGKTWKEIAAASEPSAEESRSAYTWIDLAPPGFAMIVGYHQPARRERGFPDWMDPEGARARRQLPSLSLLLQTLDQGKSWKSTAASILGRLTRTRTLPGGVGLSLVEFDDTFDWPSEVYLTNTLKGSTERVFRQKERAITDLAVLPDGTGYLAGHEPVGALSRLPVPGRVRILQSTDLVKWSDMEVDYRAVARRVFLAAPTGVSPLAATDTGMILQLAVD